jgi:hypothetical protein
MGLTSRTSAHQRVLEITFIADVSDNAFDVSNVTLSRDNLAGSPTQAVAFTVPASPGANPCFIELGEAIPQGTIIKLTGTIRA